MASTKAASVIVANPSAIHHSSSPSFAAPRLFSAIPKALSISTTTRSLRRSLSISIVAHPSPTSPTPTPTTAAPSPLRRFLSNDEPRKGTNILVEALEREGIIEVFAYPGGASMEIHQALTCTPSITSYLLHHEQGEVFAASGYAGSTGRPGICIATSGPGTTNLVSGLADALLDSIPMVTITGQVPRRMISTDTFQETPIVEVTRSITKHNYLIIDVDDIPHIIKEAFFLASSSHPSLVVVDIPKDIQQQFSVPIWDPSLPSSGTSPASPSPPPAPCSTRSSALSPSPDAQSSMSAVATRPPTTSSAASSN